MLNVLEVGESPVAHHVVTDGIAFFPCELVGERHGDERFIMRPPELHVVPVFLNGFVVHVRVVQHAAVFLVPAAGECPVDHVAAHLDEFGVIAAMAGFFQHEPSSLRSVAGVQGAFVEVVDDGAVRSHHFHDCLDVRFHEQGAEVVDAAVCPAGIKAVVISQVLAHFLSGVQRNHAGAQAGRGAFPGELGNHLAGGEAVVREDVEPVAGFTGGIPAAGRPGVRCKGDGGERFAVGVAAFADGGAVGSHMKEHAAVRRVNALGFQEFQGAFRPFEPVRILFDAVVHCQQHPCHAALGPDGFVGVHQRAVCVKAVVKTTVFFVVGAGEPERQNVFQKLAAVELAQRGHIKSCSHVGQIPGFSLKPTGRSRCLPVRNGVPSADLRSGCPAEAGRGQDRRPASPSEPWRSPYSPWRPGY